MAPLTIFAKHTQVAVIPLVTRETFFVQLNLIFHRRFMAAVATQFLVCPGERIFALFVMVEKPLLPIIGVVTQLTVQAQSFLVNLFIVFHVAISTLNLGVLERSGQMTFLTGSDCMRSKQREYRQIMVKKHLGVPPTLVVALLAFLAFFALVNVVVLVARDAVGFQFRVHVAAMTGNARHVLMTPFQLKFRVFGMVKNIACP